MSKIVVLYLDFTGLREIDEPIEDLLSRYYDIVERNIRTRGGHKLYGGRGGDDAYIVIFADPSPALQCARDIKKEFTEDLFLSSRKWDVKFGLNFVVFRDEKKEKATINCLGIAKDCCELKRPNFRNRGYLIADKNTIQNLRQGIIPTLANKFTLLEDVQLLDGSKIYRYSLINPL